MQPPQPYHKLMPYNILLPYHRLMPYNILLLYSRLMPYPLQMPSTGIPCLQSGQSPGILES